MGSLQSSVLGAHTRQFAYSGTTPRLTSVTAAGAARRVTYDAAGNETIDGAAYSPRNSLAGNDTYGYTYDARGVRTITEFASSGTLVSIVAAPTAVRGGDSVQGTVTLTEPAPAGGGVVRLMSTSSDVRVPELVLVPAGATSATFTIETETVTSDVAVNVNATRGTTSSATLTLRRSCALSGLTATPSPVTGGTTVTATLSLHEPAGAGGVTVALASSDPAVAPLPATVTVPAGESGVTFEIATAPLTASTSVTLTAELCGSVIETLDVLAPFVSGLTLDPATVRAGLPSTGTIQLSGPAPAGGAQIALASSDTAVAIVPSAVTIAAGSATANFTVSTPVRDSLASAVISATTAGVTATSLLTVNPCTPVASPPAFEPGEIVWFDDAIPPGVSQAAGWTWDSSQRASGSVSSVNAVTTSVHDRYFADSTSRLTPGDADIVFVYALIDPCNPPREIMVAWVDGNGDHRGYWGEDLLQRNGRIRIGDLPTAGEWVRLEMPATRSSLNGRSIHGLELTIDRGRVWFDRAGKRACTTPNPGPLSDFPSDEIVWFDDAPPAGATVSGQWIWDTQVRASGTAAHTDTASTGSRAHWFTVGTSPFTPAAQDQLFVYAYVDPCNVPQEILIEWYDGNWAHRSYWGTALVPNSPGTGMGDVPPAGSWIRLAVPAATLGLANRPVHGLAFTVYGGKVWFDRAGIVRCVFTSPASQPVLDPNDFVWFDDAVPAGASLSGTWTWDTTQKVSGTQSMLSSAGSGERWYGFSNAAPIAVGENDILVAHALIDGCNPPREITFWWYDGSWSHRPHWGEPLMHTGYSGTSMGAMPAGGDWVQLEMPARGMNLANRSVSAFELWTHSGRVWFDRIGKKTCIAPAASQPALSQSEVVWFDDAPPPGAVLRGNWTWNAQQRASGTLANMVPPGGESLEHWFDGATTPLTVGTNDVLTVYALIDPCDPPREIMIGWYDGSWEHRAYWGENLYTHGTPGPARRSMGPLPAPGQWVRLEVPAAAVGLAGRTITGMSFYTFAGKATFDRIGLEPGSNAALTSPPPQALTFRSRWSQRFRTLATLLTRGRTGRTASYSAYQLTPSQSPTPARLATTTTPVLRRYSLYTPDLNLLAETALTTAQDPPITHEYIWFAGQPVAQITTTTGEIAWYFNDHLGTPVLQTNASAHVIWRVERDPYGTPHSYRAGIERHQPLAFPGQEERGSETDVAYNVFRWYRAGWGRYTQADPVHGPRVFMKTGRVIAPTSNADGDQYTYTGGNPIRFTDPDGLYTRPCSPADWSNCQGDCDRIGKRLVGCGCYGVAICFGLLDYSVAACKDYQKGCPPCPSPTPPIRVDKVPPAKPHFPCKGDHWHYRRVDQGPPPSCICKYTWVLGGCL